MKTGWLWAAAGAVLLGTVARIASAPAARIVAIADAGNPFLRVGWTASTPGLGAVSLSPDGGSVAWADASGSVQRINAQTGRTVWRTSPLSGVNRVVAASGGTVAAFAGLNPERNSLVLLDADAGDKRSRVFAGSGAAWSATFAGDSVFFGTGGQAVYALPPGATTTGKPHYLLSGIPEMLAASADNSRVACATAFPAAVLGFAVGEPRSFWRVPEKDAGRQCRVSVSADGKRVLVLSTRGGSAGEAGIIRIHSGDTGTLLWQAVLPRDSSAATALLAGGGNYVAVTYRRTAKRGGPDDFRFALFDARGRRRFADKGSALFNPKVVAVASDGDTITVRSGNATFWTLDSRGNFLARLRLSPDAKTGKTVRVVDTLSSDDGRTILVRVRGDRLILLRGTEGTR